MATQSSSNSLPNLGLLALALTLMTFSLEQTEFIIPPATSLGTILLLGGGLQLMAGLQNRNSNSGAALLPLGLFWLSLIGFQVFPDLGFGRQPQPTVMVAYLSMWGFFVAILFLASFRQSRALQLVFGALMICLLLLALGQLRNNPVFLFSGGIAGMIGALAAGYTALAQLCNQGAGRVLFPLGYWRNSLENDQDEQLAS